MWNEIDNTNLKEFMKNMCYFHDTCIKEIKYISGAYVKENRSMRPINEKRTLSVVIQSQMAKISMIELRFEKLKFLKLFPNDENYTCEILDASMILKDDCVYWCDCGDLNEADILSYDGTVICASKVRWRDIDGCMGNEEFYLPKK